MWHCYVKDVKGLSKKKPSDVTNMFVKALILKPTRQTIGYLYLDMLLMKKEKPNRLHKWERELDTVICQKERTVLEEL